MPLFNQHLSFVQLLLLAGLCFNKCVGIVEKNKYVFMNTISENEERDVYRQFTTPYNRNHILACGAKCGSDESCMGIDICDGRICRLWNATIYQSTANNSNELCKRYIKASMMLSKCQQSTLNVIEMSSNQAITSPKLGKTSVLDKATQSLPSEVASFLSDTGTNEATVVSEVNTESNSAQTTKINSHFYQENTNTTDIAATTKAHTVTEPSFSTDNTNQDPTITKTASTSVAHKTTSDLQTSTQMSDTTSLGQQITETSNQTSDTITTDKMTTETSSQTSDTTITNLMPIKTASLPGNNTSYVTNTTTSGPSEFTPTDVTDEMTTETSSLTDSSTTDVLTTETSSPTDSTTTKVLITDTSSPIDSTTTKVLITDMSSPSDSTTTEVLITDRLSPTYNTTTDVLTTETSSPTDSTTTDVLTTETSSPTDSSTTNVLITDRSSLTDSTTTDVLTTETSSSSDSTTTEMSTPTVSYNESNTITDEITTENQNQICIMTYEFSGGNLEVPCFNDTYPWIVIQRRFDGSVDFYRNWTEYENGFGSLQSEIWLGNQYIHELTTAGYTVLRIELTSFKGEMRHIEYNFTIENKTNHYRLHISERNTSGIDSLQRSNLALFCTFDEDNDDWNAVNCADLSEKASSWWHSKAAWCTDGNLNGIYKDQYMKYQQGIYWFEWDGQWTLKGTRMMLRKP